MSDVVITAAVRTPIGRAAGALAEIRPDDLAAVAIKGLLEQSHLPADKVEDVIFGCSNQSGEDNRNVARMAALLAGMPVEVPGQTVNRLCGSGLQAVASAAQAARAGEGNVFIAGGVESMTRAPYVQLKSNSAWNRSAPQIADTTVGWRFINPKMPKEWTIALGETAEKVAQQHGISRADQDAFAVESQRRAEDALQKRVFSDELISVDVPGEKGAVAKFTTDEHPRAGVTLEALAKMKPAFLKDGTVTAATSSGINDGAAALAVLTSDAARNLGQKPLARIVGSAVAGVDPSVMGIGPVPAIRKLLHRTGLTTRDIDLVELNEAFAAQSIACIRELKLDPARVNIYGGAIALGHPLGASGARILTTLVHALRRTGGRYGIASMCIGVGQGIALLVERSEG